ncbi:helicase HerA-like domain-containing protein [Georgenia sp. MJ206]|uniref:helicase HerA-like domain-containing protein n=1 Tax=Georgenia wangjunii TaxID=3117730 RepID=UPI002F262E55
MADDAPSAPASAPPTGAPPASPAEIARLRAEAAQAVAEAAAARAEAAQAALDAALAAGVPHPEPATVAEVADERPPAHDRGRTDAQRTVDAPATDAPGAAEPADVLTAGTPVVAAALSEHARAVAAGYPPGDGVLPIGALVEDGAPVPGAQVGIPLGTLNRHGLVAGATGTGKTRTLQVLAEGLSEQGVPVFLTDVKGDLTGLAEPGPGGDALLARTVGIGQEWSPTAFPTELLSLGGVGDGVPIRTTVTDFGPLLLAKVLGLNDTQESSLALIFHWADEQGLALLDLKDLRATISYLTSDDGEPELKDIGGISTATAGVILREIAALQAQGADVFFGEPAFSTHDLIRTAADGRGVISALQLPALQDRPGLFSTFVMWLLADLYASLPEVGDLDKPKLVFFFDEAHLLFSGASKDFLDQVTQTVRLIRSKGVGIVFVTQVPTDVPADVLAQLGARIQHALRAFTPKDAAALREAARTFPTSPYDLEATLTSVGTGEAVVTVLSETGVPTPVAWTRVRAPRSSMAPAARATVDGVIAASDLAARYGTAVDNESAYELLAARVARQEAEVAAEAAEARAEAERAARDKELRDLQEKLAREDRASTRRTSRDGSARPTGRTALDSFLSSAGTQLGREITRTIFGTRRRR